MSEMASLTRFQGRGVTLDCPAGWRLVDVGQNTGTPIVIIVTAPVTDDGFVPNVVLSDDKMDPGTTLAQWVPASAKLLWHVLAGFHLIDMVGCEVAGQPAAWRAACYAYGGRPLMMFQWLWLELGGRRGVTATATCSLQAYRELEPVLTGIVQSYRRQGQQP